MNRNRLIFKNILFHRKAYLAVLAGVVISTTVLTGALIVGDSVRFSLGRLTDLRLGKIRYALQTNDRFFRQELASDMTLRLHLPVVPAFHTNGIAINSDRNLRINQVQVTGVDDRFGKFWDQSMRMPGTDEAIISRSVAEKLKLKPGDDFLIRIRNQGKAPSDAPFISEKIPSVSIRLTVSAIADDTRMGRFSLKNNQTGPFNIFLPLKQMASLLDLSGYANMLLAADGETSGITTHMLDSVLKICWKPVDAGLHFRDSVPAGDPIGMMDGVSQITTDRIFFDDSTANTIMRTIPVCEPILTYLVNSISAGNKSTPYSFVTAVNNSFLKQSIPNGQIIINDWLAKDLDIVPGDSVMMTYFLMGPLRSLREDSARFFVKSIIRLKNDRSDEALMPDFPGMTDAGNCRDWETNAPVDLKKIRDKDESYWKQYRGTPKAFISLDAGKHMWGNRFGNYTAFRFPTREPGIHEIETTLMQKISPVQWGFYFSPVYKEGQVAAKNATDFGELFLSLSFFILLSALLLTAMLFHMMARMRMAETGILSAIGFSKRKILGILSIETLFVTMSGAIAGIFGGIAYNYFLILGLNTIWQDAVNTSLLVMKVNPSTLLSGAAIGIVTSMTILIIILWINLKKPLSMLVKSRSGMPDPGYGKKNRVLMIIITVVSFGISGVLILWSGFQEKFLNSSLSLITGGSMLPGFLALVNVFLHRTSQPGELISGIYKLSLKNLTLRRSRTISALALISLGTFTIIITGTHRKTFYGNETTRQSGTGGFLLWAESGIPIQQDLNSANGAEISGLQDDPVLKSTKFVQLPGVDGDDASCLNLNRVSRPAMLGVPVGLFDRLDAFQFSNLDPSADRNHPWKVLSTGLTSDVIPGFADQTVITWGLGMSVGDTIFYKDESGRILKIKLLGGLDNSIFQGNILVSDSVLRRFFPSMAGARTMLIDGPVNRRDTIVKNLERLFQDHGLMVTPAADRLASFNTVENTYLSVFMMLGGLGVIIGTIGLGIVLLRNISQRKQELAIYLALGFRRKFIFKLILAEHTLILIPGLIIGSISAFPVILPLLVSPVLTVPWMYVTSILMLILANGLLWIYFPAKSAMEKDLLSGLREE